MGSSVVLKKETSEPPLHKYKLQIYGFPDGGDQIVQVNFPCIAGCPSYISLIENDWVLVISNSDKYGRVFP